MKSGFETGRRSRSPHDHKQRSSKHRKAGESCKMVLNFDNGKTVTLTSSEALKYLSIPASPALTKITNNSPNIIAFCAYPENRDAAVKSLAVDGSQDNLLYKFIYFRCTDDQAACPSYSDVSGNPTNLINQRLEQEQNNPNPNTPQQTQVKPTWFDTNYKKKCEIEIIPKYPTGYQTYYDYSRAWKMWDLICSNSVNNVLSFKSWSLQPVYICTYSRSRQQKLVYTGTYTISSYGGEMPYTGQGIRYFMYGCEQKECPRDPYDKVCKIEWKSVASDAAFGTGVIPSAFGFVKNVVPESKKTDLKGFTIKCRMEYIQMCIYATADAQQPVKVLRNKKHYNKFVNIKDLDVTEISHYYFMCTEFQEYISCPPEEKHTCIIAQDNNGTLDLYKDIQGYQFIAIKQTSIFEYMPLVNGHVSVCLYDTKEDRYPYYLALDEFGKKFPSTDKQNAKYLKFQCRHIRECERGFDPSNTCIINLAGNSTKANYDSVNYETTNVTKPSSTVEKDKLIKITRANNNYLKEATSLTAWKVSVCLYTSLYQRATPRPIVMTSENQKTQLNFNERYEFMYFWCKDSGNCPEVACTGDCCVIEQFQGNGGSYNYSVPSQITSVPNAYVTFNKFKLFKGADTYAAVCVYDPYCKLIDGFSVTKNNYYEVTKSQAIYRIKYECRSNEYTVEEIAVFCKIDRCPEPPAEICELDLYSATNNRNIHKLTQYGQITMLPSAWKKSFIKIGNPSTTKNLSVCFYDINNKPIEGKIELKATKTKSDVTVFNKSIKYIYGCDWNLPECPQEDVCKITVISTVSVSTIVDYTNYGEFITLANQDMRIFKAYSEDTKICIWYEDSISILEIRKNTQKTITNQSKILKIEFVCHGVTYTTTNTQTNQTQNQNTTVTSVTLVGASWTSFKCRKEGCNVDLYNLYNQNMSPNSIRLTQTSINMPASFPSALNFQYGLQYLDKIKSGSGMDTTLCMYYYNTTTYKYATHKIDIKAGSSITALNKLNPSNTRTEYKYYTFNCSRIETCLPHPPPPEVCILKQFSEMVQYSASYTNSNNDVMIEPVPAYSEGSYKFHLIKAGFESARQFTIENISGQNDLKGTVCVYNNKYDQNPEKIVLEKNKPKTTSKTNLYSLTFWCSTGTDCPVLDCNNRPECTESCAIKYMYHNENNNWNTDTTKLVTITANKLVTQIQSVYDQITIVCIFSSADDQEGKKNVFMRKDEIWRDIQLTISSQYSITWMCFKRSITSDQFLREYKCRRPPPEPPVAKCEGFKVIQSSPYFPNNYRFTYTDDRNGGLVSVPEYLQTSRNFKNDSDNYIGVCTYNCNDSNPYKLILAPRSYGFSWGTQYIYALSFNCPSVVAGASGLQIAYNKLRTEWNCPAFNNVACADCNLKIITSNQTRYDFKSNQANELIKNVSFNGSTTYKAFNKYIEICLYTSSTDRYGYNFSIQQNGAASINTGKTFTEFIFVCYVPGDSNRINRLNCERPEIPIAPCELKQFTDSDPNNITSYTVPFLSYQVSESNYNKRKFSSSVYNMAVCLRGAGKVQHIAIAAAQSYSFTSWVVKEVRFACYGPGTGANSITYNQTNYQYIIDSCKPRPEDCPEPQRCELTLYKKGDMNITKVVRADPNEKMTLFSGFQFEFMKNDQNNMIICLYRNEYDQSPYQIKFPNCKQRNYTYYTQFAFYNLNCPGDSSYESFECYVPPPAPPTPPTCNDAQRSKMSIAVINNGTTQNLTKALYKYSIGQDYSSFNLIKNLSSVETYVCVWTSEGDCSNNQNGNFHKYTLAKNSQISITTTYNFKVLFDCASNIDCSQHSTYPPKSCDCCKVEINSQKYTGKNLQQIQGFPSMMKFPTAMKITNLKGFTREMLICAYKKIYDRNPSSQILSAGAVMSQATGLFGGENIEYIAFFCVGCGSVPPKCEPWIIYPNCSIKQLDPFWNVNTFKTYNEVSGQLIQVDPAYWYAYYFQNLFDKQVSVCLYKSRCDKNPQLLQINANYSMSAQYTQITYLMYFCVAINECPTFNDCDGDDTCVIDVTHGETKVSLTNQFAFNVYQNNITLVEAKNHVLICLSRVEYSYLPSKQQLAKDTSMRISGQTYNAISFLCLNNFSQYSFRDLTCYHRIPPPYPNPIPNCPGSCATCSVIAGSTVTNSVQTYSTAYNFYNLRYFSIDDRYVSFNRFQNTGTAGIKVCLYSYYYASNAANSHIEAIYVAAGDTKLSQKTSYYRMIMFCNVNYANWQIEAYKCPDIRIDPPPSCAITIYGSGGNDERKFTISGNPGWNNLQTSSSSYYIVSHSNQYVNVCFYKTTVTTFQTPTPIGIPNGDQKITMVPSYNSNMKFYYVCGSDSSYHCETFPKEEPPVPPIPQDQCKIDQSYYGNYVTTYTTSRVYTNVINTTYRTFYNYSNKKTVICLYHNYNTIGVKYILLSHQTITVEYTYFRYVWFYCEKSGAVDGQQQQQDGQQQNVNVDGQSFDVNNFECPGPPPGPSPPIPPAPQPGCEVVLNFPATNNTVTNKIDYWLSQKLLPNTYVGGTFLITGKYYQTTVCLYTSKNDPSPYKVYLPYQNQQVAVNSPAHNKYKYYAFICSYIPYCPLIPEPPQPPKSCLMVQSLSRQASTDYTVGQIPPSSNGVKGGVNFVYVAGYYFNHVVNTASSWKWFKNVSTVLWNMVCVYNSSTDQEPEKIILGPGIIKETTKVTVGYMFYLCAEQESNFSTINCPPITPDPDPRCIVSINTYVNNALDNAQGQVFNSSNNFNEQLIHDRHRDIKTIHASSSATVCLYRNEKDAYPYRFNFFNATTFLTSELSQSRFEILKFICEPWKECPVPEPPVSDCSLTMLGNTDTQYVTYDRQYSWRRFYLMDTSYWQYRRFKNSSGNSSVIKVCLWSDYLDPEPESIEIKPNETQTSTKNIARLIQFGCNNTLTCEPGPQPCPRPPCPPPDINLYCEVYGLKVFRENYKEQNLFHKRATAYSSFRFHQLTSDMKTLKLIKTGLEYTHICLYYRNESEEVKVEKTFVTQKNGEWEIKDYSAEGYTPFQYAFVCTRSVDIHCPPYPPPPNDPGKCILRQTNSAGQFQEYTKAYTSMIQGVPSDWSNFIQLSSAFLTAKTFKNLNDKKMKICLYKNTDEGNLKSFELLSHQEQIRNENDFTSYKYLQFTCTVFPCPTPPSPPREPTCSIFFNPNNNNLRIPGIKTVTINGVSTEVPVFEPISHFYQFSETTVTQLKKIKIEQSYALICLYKSKTDPTPAYYTDFRSQSIEIEVSLTITYTYFTYKCFGSAEDLRAHMNLNGTFASGNWYNGCNYINKTCENDDWDLLQGLDSSYSNTTEYTKYSHFTMKNLGNKLMKVDNAHKLWLNFKNSSAWNISVCVLSKSNDQNPSIFNMSANLNKVVGKSSVKLIKYKCGNNSITKEECVSHEPTCELQIFSTGNGKFNFNKETTEFKTENLIAINSENTVQIKRMKSFFNYMWVCLYKDKNDCRPQAIFLQYKDTSVYIANTENQPNKYLMFICSPNRPTCPISSECQPDDCQLAYSPKNGGAPVTVRFAPDVTSVIPMQYNTYNYKNISSSRRMKICAFDQVSAKTLDNTIDASKILTSTSTSWYLWYTCSNYDKDCNSVIEKCKIQTSISVAFDINQEFTNPNTSFNYTTTFRDITESNRDIKSVKNVGGLSVRVCLFRDRNDPYPLEFVIMQKDQFTTIYQYKYMKTFKYLKFSCDAQYIYEHENVTRRFCWPERKDTCEITQNGGGSSYTYRTEDKVYQIDTTLRNAGKDFTNLSTTQIAYVCLYKDVYKLDVASPVVVPKGSTTSVTYESANQLIYYCDDFSKWSTWSWLDIYFRQFFGKGLNHYAYTNVKTITSMCPEIPPWIPDPCRVEFMSDRGGYKEDFYGQTALSIASFSSFAIHKIPQNFINNVNTLTSYYDKQLVVCIYKEQYDRNPAKYILDSSRKTVTDLMTHNTSKIWGYVIGCNPLLLELECPKPPSPRKCYVEQSQGRGNYIKLYKKDNIGNNVTVQVVYAHQLVQVPTDFRTKTDSIFTNHSIGQLEICVYSSKTDANPVKMELKSYLESKTQGKSSVHYIYWHCGPIVTCELPPPTALCTLIIEKQGEGVPITLKDFHSFQWFPVSVVLRNSQTLSIKKLTNGMTTCVMTVCYMYGNGTVKRNVLRTPNSFADVNQDVTHLAYVCAETDCPVPTPPPTPPTPEDICTLKFTTMEWDTVVLTKKYTSGVNYRLYRLLHCVGEYEVNYFINVYYNKYTVHICLYQTLTDESPKYISINKNTQKSGELTTDDKKYKFMSFYCGNVLPDNKCPVFTDGSIAKKDDVPMAFIQTNEKIKSHENNDYDDSTYDDNYELEHEDM